MDIKTYLAHHYSQPIAHLGEEERRYVEYWKLTADYRHGRIGVKELLPTMVQALSLPSSCDSCASLIAQIYQQFENWVFHTLWEKCPNLLPKLDPDVFEGTALAQKDNYLALVRGGHHITDEWVSRITTAVRGSGEPSKLQAMLAALSKWKNQRLLREEVQQTSDKPHIKAAVEAPSQEELILADLRDGVNRNVIRDKYRISGAKLNKIIASNTK